MIVTFLALFTPEGTEPHGVLVYTDMLKPGYGMMYRYVPNLGGWWRDEGLFKDYHTWWIDQLNRFEEITPEQAVQLVKVLPEWDLGKAGWRIGFYHQANECLSSEDLGLVVDGVSGDNSASPVNSEGG